MSNQDKFIDVVFSCPPSAEFPQYIVTADESGEEVQVGEWVRPSAEDPFWRLRLRPEELLLRMIAPGRELPQAVMGGDKARDLGASAAREARRALKDKLTSAPRKQQPPELERSTIPEEAGEKCPSCEKYFDARKDSLLSCPECGGDKCTAICLPDSTGPCLDCQALKPDPGEGGFDPELKVAAARAVGRRLFDGQFHGKPGAAAADEDEEDAEQ